MAANATEDNDFARLVLLACHDLRTPLATVHGFAQTLVRTGEFEDPAARYLEMIDTASGQIADLIDELALFARIEAGGEGARLKLDADATERAVAALARCALRHGGLEQVRLSARGTSLELSPVTPASAPVVLGEDLRDLGAAVAVRVLRAQGGSVELDGETLHIGLA